jgi:hypothetical protein
MPARAPDSAATAKLGTLHTIFEGTPVDFAQLGIEALQILDL